MQEVTSGKSPEQKWRCVTLGVAFDYVAVQSKAVMLRLLGEKHLFVRLLHAVTAWQPQFHQREGRERELDVWSKCTTAFMVRTRSFFFVLVRTDAYHFLCSLTICL